jgi:hypothetical protein
MKNDGPVTLDEYKEVAPDFFPRYHYVAQELGEGAKGEDILKVMETMTALVYKKRSEEKTTSIGFNKTDVDVGVD